MIFRSNMSLFSFLTSFLEIGLLNIIVPLEIDPFSVQNNINFEENAIFLSDTMITLKLTF